MFPQNLYIEALTGNIAVFGELASMEVIKVKWVGKVGP